MYIRAKNLRISKTHFRFGTTYVGTKMLSPVDPATVLMGDVDPSGNMTANIVHSPLDRLRCKMIAQARILIFFDVGSPIVVVHLHTRSFLYNGHRERGSSPGRPIIFAMRVVIAINFDFAYLACS